MVAVAQENTSNIDTINNDLYGTGEQDNVGLIAGVTALSATIGALSGTVAALSTSLSAVSASVVAAEAAGIAGSAAVGGAVAAGSVSSLAGAGGVFGLLAAGVLGASALGVTLVATGSLGDNEDEIAQTLVDMKTKVDSIETSADFTPISSRVTAIEAKLDDPDLPYTSLKETVVENY